VSPNGLRETRSNALWGRSGKRANALWGRSGKSGVVALAAAAMLVVPIAGSAASKSAKGSHSDASSLLQRARANPDQVFSVIVQSKQRSARGGPATAIAGARADHPGKAKGLTKQLGIINGAAAELTGAQIAELAATKGSVSISEDVPVVADATPSSTSCANCPFEGIYWPYITGVTGFWQKPGAKATPAPQAPAIAVVDSGIDASSTIFGGRVVKQVTMTSRTPNSPGDGFGHGTFVAGIASGMIGGNWGGASPTSKLISLDVMDDKGEARTSDVIAAAEWIYQHKDEYGIRVANFSLHAEGNSSFLDDPLDRAVEKLWLSGVVVVAAAGNYADSGKPSGVLYAPGNDPFVLTVGALDVNNTLDVSDDSTAPWSSYGYTLDGFAKPDLGAPGRYMIGAVPATSSMPLARPDRVIGPGFMWMSGTSFAAPVAAGAAADLLALHPTWTPDQVKGALMLSAKPIAPSAPARSSGVGELKLDAAALVNSPPNPNLALEQFLVPDPSGGAVPVFSAASWVDAATANTAWDTSSWSGASWSTASWGEASWGDASWGEASWATASWGDASWADASWGDGSGSDASWADLFWLK
jgi:serine protease AprX